MLLNNIKILSVIFLFILLLFINHLFKFISATDLTLYISAFSILIYSFALFNSINQNKILLSQNIKPYYEKRIDNLITKSEKNKIYNKVLFNNEDVNAMNFISYIDKCLLNFANNSDYSSDYSKYEKGLQLTSEYFLNCSYIKEIRFLTEISSKIGIVNSFLRNNFILIEEINKSNLIEVDKKILKSRIFDEILSDYMNFMKLDIKTNFSPLFPKINYSKTSEFVSYVKVSDILFLSTYNDLKSEQEKL